MRRFLTGLMGVFAAVAAEAAALPFGYEPVEYIESTLNGGQFIDTGYIHKENTKIVCEVNAAASQKSGTDWMAVFGACNDNWRHNAFAFFVRDGNERVRYNRTGEEGFGPAFPRDVRTTITCEGKIAKWSASSGGESSVELSNPDVKVDGGVCPLLIFVKNDAPTSNAVGEDGSKAVMKLYSFQIYEDEELKCDFVPCIEKLTGKAGLYDTVGRKFHGNAGNGDFIAGLPSRYKPVEYIESTRPVSENSCPYIDTGYSAKPESRFVADIDTMQRNAPWTVFFGTAKEDASGEAILLRYIDDTPASLNAWFCSTDWTQPKVGGFENKRIAVELMRGKVIVNGESHSFQTMETPSPYQGSVYLFCANKGGSPWRGQQMRLYSFKIYEGDNPQPVRDFVPCVEWATGKAGLYDTVSHKFHGNAGSGDFLTELPAGYKPVEYIESTKGGQQYINTGYAPKANTKVECVVNVPDNQPVGYPAVFGSHSGDMRHSANMTFFPWYSGRQMTAYNRGGVEKAGGDFFYDEKVSLTCVGPTASWRTVNDFSATGMINIVNAVITDGDSNYPIYIFALDGPNGKMSPPCPPRVHTYLAMKLYGFKIYEGEKLERNFVPCAKTDSGELGLYDMVEGKFYGNAGKGAFQTGLPPGYDAVEYIESTKGGRQYINTGYVPKANTKVECVVNVADKQVTTHAVVFGAQTMRAGNTGNRNNMSFFAWFNRSPATAYNRGAQEKAGDPFGYDVKVRLVCNKLTANWSLMDGLALGEITNPGSIKDGNPDYPLYIFALDEPNGNKKPYPPFGHTYLAMKLYSFKIYEGDNPRPVHDFVPCVERATGKAGLYDTVHHKFHGNAGNGGDFLTEQPSGYRPVEYIESTPDGKQYINTEYIHKANTKIVCSVSVADKQAQGYPVVFGSYAGSWRSNAFAFFAKFHPEKYANPPPALGRTGNEQAGDSNSFPFDTRVDLVCEGKQASWRRFGEASVCGSINNTAATADNGVWPINLFVNNNNGGQAGNTWCAMKLYSFKIYEGDVLVRDFVPCVETATGEAGLRDRVGGAFYRSKGPSYFNAPLPFGRELTSGTYTFEESVMYAAPATESALKIAENLRVTLRIPAGVTVTLFGGNAQGKVGAGAGIEVPKTSSLSVVGDGKLVAVGGNAANGSAGGRASEGWVRPNSDGSGKDWNGQRGPKTSLYFCNGGGGAGGDGGGGAGAGIGGRGGNGGAGGAGAASVTKDWNLSHSEFMTTGLPGYAGASGGAGGEPGRVTIAETLTVDIRSGDAGKGGAGGAGASVHFSWDLNCFGAWGGGGGGGGGAGAAAEAGFGGVGGGGGGGGGSGALDFFANPKRFLSHNQYGTGGLGGQGATGSTDGNGGVGTNKCGEEITVNGLKEKTGTPLEPVSNYARPGGPGAGGAAGTFSLPSGYEQIEYIESTPGGGQYINTGCTPHTNTTVVCRLRDDGTGIPPGESASGAVFGSGIGIGEHRGMSFWLRQSGVVKPYYGRAGDGGGKNKESFPFGDITTVNCHGRRCSWVSDAGMKTNGIELTSEFYEENQEEGVAPMTIFALNAQNEKGVCQPADFWNFKLYGFQIYEGARMVRNFIPCIELETGKSGLYDLVGRKFYGNAGSGAGFKPELPSEYKRVEYIESTKGGGQYIDTNYRANANTRVVMDAYVFPRKEQADTWGVLFGSRTLNSWTTKSFSFQMADGVSGIDSFRFAYNGQFRSDGNKPFSYGERISLVCDGQHVEWTGSKVGSVPFTASPLDQSKSTLYIFGDNSVENDGEKRKDAYNPSVMKLYSFKIYEGDELVRSYVPCVNSSGVAGLYELIKGGFYANVGTGAFNVGFPAVPYWDPLAQAQRSAFCEIVTKDTAKLEGGKWYAVMGPVERGMIEVNGSANLILCDGATLTATGARDQAGVRVAKGHSLVIYGQAEGTGALVAKGTQGGSGIGGSVKQAGGTVTINGGTVTATGGHYGAAGIGGGWSKTGADGGIVTINGGTVTATGGRWGAGIGGGKNGGAGSTMTINGGTVTATAGAWSAGIGGGYLGAGGTVTINGGLVTASGGDGGAGIGGGNGGSAKGKGGSGGIVTINDGMVMATGGYNAAGIGGGKQGAGGAVTINGGTVTARCVVDGIASIGAGNGGTSHGVLMINGGSVGVRVLGPRPVNRDWELLQHVTVKTDGLDDPTNGLKIEGLPSYYNTTGIHPIDNRVHLWLPSSREGYLFKVSDGKQLHTYFAMVTDRAVTATQLEARLRVNGRDIAAGTGEGWNYSVDGLLTLNKQMDYVLEGAPEKGSVRIAVEANANVTLSNTVINAVSAPTITVNDGCTLHLSTADDGASYLLTDVGQPVLRGGKTVVDRGQLCLWTDSSVPVDCAADGFTVADEKAQIMSLGKDMDTMRYVEKYEPNDDDRILLVGPRCQLTVPFVSNATVTVALSLSEGAKDLEGKSTDEGMVYEVMDGDVVIVCVLPDEGYVLRGPAPVQWFEIVGNTTLAPSDLPIAVVGSQVFYRTADVDETGAVTYGFSFADAMLFDEIADRPDVVGKGLYGEEWYVVTGEVDCASICVTEGTVNLILYPGANLTLMGNDGEPGLGVMSNACLNVYGCDFGDADDDDEDYYGERIGTLVAFGGPYAAGIGGGGAEVLDDAPGADAGWITVNGGQVIAWGGDFGAGIGGGAFGAGAYLEVNGGSVFAYAGYDADDIGGGAYGEDGVTVVRGGNVMGNSVEAKPVKANANPDQSSEDEWEQLYRVYVVSEKFLREDGKALTVEGLEGFGTADIFPNEDGAICLYLPNGDYEFKVDGWKCIAVVADETATAEVGEKSEEGGDESGEGEGESGEGEGEGSEEGRGERKEILGIEVGATVKVIVRAEEGRTYRLRRVALVDGKWVDGDVVWSVTAADDILMEESATLTLEDNNPPAGAGFYVVEEEK